MTSEIIQPLKPYRIIVAGDLDAAVDAWAKYSQRPLRKVEVNPMQGEKGNGYGAVHATVNADPTWIHEWFEASRDRGPGALLFFHSV